MPEPTQATATQPLTPEQEDKVYRPDQEWSDDFALKVAVQDFHSAEAYRTTNCDWRWRDHFRLYEAYVEQKYWEGTRIPRASLPIYLAFAQIESMLPKIRSAIFADNPWFQVEPEPGTKAEDARAVRDFVLMQMDQTRVREVLRLWLKSGLIHGDGIMELSWLQKKTTRKKYVSQWQQDVRTYNDPITGQAIQFPAGLKRVLTRKEFIEIENRPELKNILLPDFYIDPNCPSPDPQGARYAITRALLSVDEVDALRQNEEFKIPPKDILLAMARYKPSATGDVTKTTAETARQGYYSPATDQTVDPGGQRLEMLCYWSVDRCVYVLDRRHVAYNAINPYGFLPFYHFSYADVLGRFYAMGMCDVLEGEQRFRTSLRNARVDEIALNIHRPMIKRRGLTIPAYMLRQRPGQVLEADNPKEDFQFPDPPNILQSAYIEDQYSALEAQKVTGMSDVAAMGTAPAGGNSANRTAAGIGVQAQATYSRIQYLVENAEDIGIEPMLRDVLKLNQLYPPIGDVQVPGINGQLSQVNPEIIVNSSVKFKMRASAKMQARMALMQAFPLIFQTLANPALMGQLAQQGEAVNFKELINVVLDMTGYKNRADLIRPLTPEEKQAMNQPPAEEMIRMQMQRERIQGQQQTSDKKLAADTERDTERAQMDLVKAIMPKAMDMLMDEEEEEDDAVPAR